MRVYALPPCLDSAARLGQPPTLKETTPSASHPSEKSLPPFFCFTKAGGDIESHFTARHRCRYFITFFIIFE